MSNWNKYKNLIQIKLDALKIELNKHTILINELKKTFILAASVHIILTIIALLFIDKIEKDSNLFYFLCNYIHVYLQFKIFLIKCINNYFYCFYVLGESLKYLYIQYFYMFYLLGVFLDEKGTEIDIILNEMISGTNFSIFLDYYTKCMYYLALTIVNYFNLLPYIIKTSIINIILIILFILIGGVIPLLERKYLSLIQRRIGPKYVGYNGRLQFIADAMKLLLKEIIYLHNTNKLVLTILPIYTLSINLFILLNIIFLNNIKLLDINIFILILLLIELITTIVLTYIGFLVKNKYTIIASTRLLNGVIVFEIFITSVYLYFYLFFNKLSLNNITNSTIINKFLIFSINLPIFFNFILINLKRVPYDIIEAETELIMGYSTEHSGFLSGALLLIEYTHIFLWSYIIIIFIF